jgi:hypothetical protein
MTCSYVLPIRLSAPADDELVAYVRWLSALVEVIVVDGSTNHIFANHAARFGNSIVHLAPDADVCRFANGKVAGVVTGVRRASHESLVIADDDVRYDERALAGMIAALACADVVRPQNYFDPIPWHAGLDTARTLLNRISGGDWPGTLGVRRSRLVATNGYDGDVMFENLELVRTVTASGGVEAIPLDLYVRRLPPTADHFWSQRVRQAYDEFAQPARMALFLAVLPAAALLPRRYLAAAAVAAVALAEAGRRRAGGDVVFPASATLLAPVWLVERGTCAWLAVGTRFLFGGVRYAGGRLRNAGNQFGRKTARTQLSSLSLKMR